MHYLQHSQKYFFYNFIKKKNKYFYIMFENNLIIIKNFKILYNYFILYDINVIKWEKEHKIYKYKLIALKKIINILKNFKEHIISWEQLNNIDGIGKNTLSRIDEI